MDAIETRYTGLARELKPYVEGLEEVELLLGKDYVFHDAEIDEIHIVRADNTVMIIMWTGSDVDRKKHYAVIWRLEDCISIDLSDYEPNGGSPYVFELSFERSSLFPDRITVIFDGTGVVATCRHIIISLEEK